MDFAVVSLWGAVLALGAWHGLNPAMGWPLAVARGLERRRARAVLSTWMPLGAGHLAAMALVLAPFAALTWLVAWSRELRLGAGVLVVAFGLWRLASRRHPRWLARVRPTQLAWWSFLMATAHGAALMLVPVLLGLCATGAPPGRTAIHADVMRAMGAGLAAALGIAAVHTLAMIATGLAVAWVVFRYLGLQVLRSVWLDLDAVWGSALVLSGVAALALAAWGP